MNEMNLSVMQMSALKLLFQLMKGMLKLIAETLVFLIVLLGVRHDWRL